MEHLKPPCDGCLILPVCKERLRDIDNDLDHKLSGYAGWKILAAICKLVENHLKKIQYHGVCNDNLGYLEQELLRIYGDVYNPSISYSYYKINKRAYRGI